MGKHKIIAAAADDPPVHYRGRVSVLFQSRTSIGRINRLLTDRNRVVG